MQDGAYLGSRVDLLHRLAYLWANTWTAPLPMSSGQMIQHYAHRRRVSE